MSLLRELIKSKSCKGGGQRYQNRSQIIPISVLSELTFDTYTGALLGNRGSFSETWERKFLGTWVKWLVKLSCKLLLLRRTGKVMDGWMESTLG